MNMVFWIGLTIIGLGLSLSEVEAQVCDASRRYCGDVRGGGRSSRSASPSSGSAVRLNPSNVPVEKGFGIEGIYFDDAIDFSLVRGLGRVGAAISPSNSEETFFGPPGIELEDNYLERKQGKDRYESQKYTGAGAVNLLSSRGSGFKHFSLNLGLMGKYNKETEAIMPGGGLSGYWGPFSYGYSIYEDQTLLQSEPDFGVEQSEYLYKYKVQTFSGGIYFKGFIFDYSVMKMDGELPSTVTLLTGSVLLKRAVITLSSRNEKSDRKAYNYETTQLEEKEEKTDLFGGLQFKILKPLMIGAFYNYYLHREISLGATLFF